MSKIHRNISRGAFQYLWHEQALLSREEAMYALERLWYLVAGNADWVGEPVLSIPAVDEATVQAMFALPPDELTWVPLRDILPSGVDLDLDTTQLPALCQVREDTPQFKTNSDQFPLDLVATTFLLLSRWEEYHLRLPTDIWGNTAEETIFPARQSFLNRPVLDEWALVLRAWIKVKHPTWQAKPNLFRVLPTHDIDHLFRYPSVKYLPRRVVGTAWRTRQFTPTVRALVEGVTSLQRPETDPCWQIIYDLADRNEAINAPCIFFFMTARKGLYDDGYTLDHPLARKLLRNLTERGHTIGWHPGYQAAESRMLFFEQAKRLHSIEPKGLTVMRMHYLRWRKQIPVWMEKLGIEQDHTWGLNDGLGFAHGTAKPFIQWDLTRNCATKIIETPLLVQDNPFAKMVIQNGLIQATSLVNDIYKRTKQVGGVYSFLIHNNVHYGKIEYISVADFLYSCINVNSVNTSN